MARNAAFVLKSLAQSLDFRYGQVRNQKFLLAAAQVGGNASKATGRAGLLRVIRFSFDE